MRPPFAMRAATFIPDFPHNVEKRGTGRMRTTSIVVALLAFVAEGAWAQATPAPSKPAPARVEVVVPHGYVGLAAGQTIFSIQDDSLNAPGATQSTLNSGKNETGYRFFAGYRFHRNLSIEG